MLKGIKGVYTGSILHLPIRSSFRRSSCSSCEGTQDGDNTYSEESIQVNSVFRRHFSYLLDEQHSLALKPNEF